MAVTLIVEDGTAVTGANTYISLAGAETYFEARLDTATWDTDTSVTPSIPRTDDSKNRALVQATRTLDARATFQGRQITNIQALSWPRDDVIYEQDIWASNDIPPDLLDATCEQAIYLLGADRTKDYQGAGLKSFAVGNEAVDIEFDPSSEAGLLPDVVIDMLGPWATSLGGNVGTVPIVRV